MPLGKCKLKQEHITTRLLEWPKSKTLTPPNAGVKNSEIVQVNPMHFTKVLFSTSVMCTSEKTVHEVEALKPKHGMRLRGILSESSLYSEETGAYLLHSDWL